jgi:hypothetical protein
MNGYVISASAELLLASMDIDGPPRLLFYNKKIVGVYWLSR